MKISKYILFLFFASIPQIIFGQIKLPSIISDNMVLEQKSTVPLWGEATTSHKVTITTSWTHKKYTTKSNKEGKWRVEIQTPEVGGPYTITFSDGNELTIKNVLIGEVWVCSGQSNMEKPMKGGVNEPILNSNDILVHANESKLRLFHIERKVSNTPLNDVKGSWEHSSPESASTFSAVGYQFAKKLQETMHVPVGIVEVAWGGTPIRSWMNKKSIKPFIAELYPNSKRNKDQPSVLFNGMINPIVGYGIKGFIWYQGEWDRQDPSMYKDMMVNMIKGWRSLWERGSLPFYYVQIAPYDYKGALQDSVPYVREAQAQVMETLPHVGMAVSMDVGNKYTIHPPDKTTIAERLLYWALGDVYHWKGIAYKSPSFQSMEIKGNNIIVSFNHTPRGLTSFDQKINGFELAGKNKVFYPAKAKINGKGQVSLYSNEVPHPIAVRYLFKDWVDAHLYNTEGLPVAPFRTDNW